MNIKFYSLVLSMALLFVGCASSNTTTDFEVEGSKLNRNLNPTATQSELTNLAKDNNTFAFDMFAKLQTSESGNIFFSPYSISEALVMTYAGAKGNTKSEMASVLHFNANDELLNNSYNALDLHLNYTDNNYTFSIANSLWAQKNYKFLNSYLDTIKLNYGADVNLLNFAESEKSRKAINSWVEDKTHQKIKDLIPKNILDSSTKLVLTNAVYFKGEWAEKFEKSNTSNDTFIKLNGSTEQVSFMRQTKDFNYSESEDYQAVNLKYVGDRTSMLIVLPKDGKFQEVISDIKNIYQDIEQNLSLKKVNLRMPKFEFTTGSYELKKYFQELGMVDAFGADADFSGMSGDKDLYIESILHKAFIKVDEAGTEAAAATAVLVFKNGVIPGDNIINMFVNKAFIFFIKDTKTGQILFAGVIKKP